MVARLLSSISVALVVTACGLYEPYVSGIGSLSGEPRKGFECKGQRHPSGAPYVTEGSDGGLYSFGVCPGTQGYAARKAMYLERHAPSKLTPDIPRTPVIVPEIGIVRP
jgi:hypothetical protein